MPKHLALVGGQFGSEGKGLAAGYLAKHFNVAVRCGGPNAGHTAIHDGHVIKFRSIPVAAINPNCSLFIGPGAVLSIRVLMDEINALEGIGIKVRNRLFISRRATVINETLHDEGHTHGELHHRIGSTGEGVGAARMARMSRDRNRFKLAEEYDELTQFFTHDGFLTHRLSRGDRVMLEGAQGFGLSLTFGDWPFVTSADTTAAQLCADSGMPTDEIVETMMVVRTLPIRVAGNSGPLKGEITWESVSKKIGREVIERTTVTKKVRRVGEWDHDMFIQACNVMRPKHIFVTFLDYLSNDVKSLMNKDGAGTRFLSYVETVSGHDVSHASFGPTNNDVINFGRFQ